jgi:hypothetical protein
MYADDVALIAESESEPYFPLYPIFPQ